MSHPRLSLACRTGATSLGLLVFALAGAAGCGRSDLDDYLIGDGGITPADGAPDGKPEGGACNATTCPGGCCDTSGQCQAGSSATQCGTGGESCHDCQAEGFQFCDPSLHACGSKVGSCGAANCTGCCEGATCFAGNDPNECGGGGVACKHCQSAGLACAADQCVQSQCGPQNCKGCCFGDQCLTGIDQTACGSAGQQCANCAGMNETCVSAGGGGTCRGQATCDAKTCPGGCCDATGRCVAGTSNAQCGTGGGQCQDCAALDESCQKQTCVNVPPPVCNASNCPGCCDANGVCQPGFVDSRCGENGAACADCTALAPPSTCDVNVTPRACTSQQAQCPAPYPSCPANLQTPTPTIQKACSASELQNAGSACSAGAHSTGCQSFFSFEASKNPACGKCLSSFDYNFAELTGLFACIAPFVGASCNHDTACIVDCMDRSCAMCSGAGATSQCQSAVRSGQCSSYFTSCVAMGLSGPGSFCNPSSYQDDFAGWLAGVGTHYCAQ